ncbi:hypothetical protein K438DRAFT_1750212 [Mycena galopus ATCC 62051]|nr:hypothetical protein K438DRAFT_1750212 [Mycena galopus ATCC 62051]
MTLNQSTSPPPASGSKRIPRAGACDICRQRKICTYNPPKKRGPKNGTMLALKKEIMSLKSKLQSQSPIICSVCAKPLSPPHASWSTFTSHRNTSDSDASSEPGDEPDDKSESAADDLGRRFTQLSLKHYGSASSFRLLTTTIAMKAKHLGNPQLSHSRRPLFWDTLPWEKEAYERRTRYVYPADDLIASLVALYFDNLHWIMPILHRPSFEQAVAKGLHLTDTEFGGTLLSVLATASRYSDDPRVLVDGAPLSAGWNFANQVQHLRPLSMPTINEVQIYFLLSLYTFGTSVPRMSWLYLGLGIRCLHERREFRRKPDGHKTDPQHELWKRAFWYDVSYDVEPLVEVDDEYWDRGFTQPPGKPSQLSYFVYQVRLCEVISDQVLLSILGDVIRQLYGSEKSKTLIGSESAVAALDSAMNQFLDSIPAHLRWNDERSLQDAFFDQSAALHVTYNHVLMAIHRPSITVPAAPSLSICARAARTIIHTANIWLNKRQRLPPPNVALPVFSSGVILVLYTLAANRTSADKNKDFVHVATAMEILKYGESRVQTAGRLWELLQHTWSLSSPLPLNSAQSSTSVLADMGPPGPVSLPSTDVDASFLSNVPDEYYTPPEPVIFSDPVFPFGEVAGPRAGMSVEELLAAADPLDIMGRILDDELWMAAPTHAMNFNHWEGYFENRNNSG